jgi:porin
LYQGASTALPGAEDSAASGVFRVYGTWTLAGRDTENSGNLVFKFENRHRLGTGIPPSALGFGLGYLGVTGTLFSDVAWILNDFNWQQRLSAGRSGLIIGRFDPNDYLDVLGYANPWTTFQNLAILFNTSIALADTSFGAAGGSYIGDRVYLLASVNDANGTVSEVEFFEGGSEFYKSVEIGWTPDPTKRFTHNAHVTTWHVDAREDAGVPQSDGLSIGANWTFDSTWMPFFRAGWSDGQAPFMNRAVTLGVLRYFSGRSDLSGLGVNWGDPSDGSLRDQTTAELFYRIQLAQNLALTPSLQLLKDPALHPQEDRIWVFGLRARLTL